jgi:hypothetical protein
MRSRTAIAAAALALALTACSHKRDDAAARKDRNAGDSIAREAGKAAYHAAQGTRKVAEAAGRALDRASHDARQGWNDASREKKDKAEK